MIAIDQFHKFVQKKVETPKEDLPAISFRTGVTAFAAVVIAELSVFLCLYFLFVPDNNASVSTHVVTATQALAGLAGCDAWTDVTQYPASGLALPRLSRIADVRLQGPVSNETIWAILPNLTCVGPSDRVAEALGLNIMLGVDAYGWQSYSGKTESTCTHPDVPNLVVNNLANSWEQSCFAVLGRARTYYSNLLRRHPEVSDAPELMGIECAMNVALPVHGQFRYFFHWPENRSRWGITGWLWFFCDGLLGVQQDFLINNKRNMTSDEVAAVTNGTGLCARSFNGSCLRSYRKQKWGKSSEYIRLEPARFQCSSILNAYTGRSDPSWAPGCRNNVNGEQIYFQDPSPGHFTPPNGTSFEGDPSLAIKMLEDLSAIPEGQAPSMTNMPSSCPGRTSKVWDVIGPSDTNKKEVELLLQAYGDLEMFTFTCTQYSSPRFSQRLSYIFPYLNIAHAIAMTYLIRYVYMGLRVTNDYVSSTLKSSGLDARAGSATNLEETQPGPITSGPSQNLRDFEQVLDLMLTHDHPQKQHPQHRDKHHNPEEGPSQSPIPSPPPSSSRALRAGHGSRLWEV